MNVNILILKINHVILCISEFYAIKINYYFINTLLFYAIYYLIIRFHWFSFNFSFIIIVSLNNLCHKCFWNHFYSICSVTRLTYVVWLSTLLTSRVSFILNRGQIWKVFGSVELLHTCPVPCVAYIVSLSIIRTEELT